MIAKKVITPLLLIFPLALSACDGGQQVATVEAETMVEEAMTYEASYTEDGALIRIDGWREWVFIGNPVTPNGLNGGAAPFPESHAVYIDPESWAHWKATGTFREGTLIAKELSMLYSEGGANED
ncbi:MAG: cytochrome P460 family protein, partial [Alphaproteobacteria bacterium]